jgi:predicted MPP superfamily phosphohydrolase
LVKEVNELKPDLIVFTGDMVNNFSSELLPWIETLQKLKADYGKYAVTGNHDYGDYSLWNSKQEKEKNLKQFYQNMENAGFHMLNNAHIPIVIQNDTLWLVGVENWGKPPFSQYGNLSKALEGVPENSLIILLTHDPSHWRAEVLSHPIALTLSGHTHAMQMGVEIGHVKWSPAKYIYPEYDGLYQQGKQYLYVNRGQGYLGLPGRIGMQPEITQFTLKNSPTPL